MFSANQNSNTWNSYNGNAAKFTVVVNNNDSKFIKYQSVPPITGITSTDCLTTNFLISKCGIASQGAYNSSSTFPNNFLNFYYDSVNNKIELWLVSGTITDIGGFTNNSFTNQRLGYIT